MPRNECMLAAASQCLTLRTSLHPRSEAILEDGVFAIAIILSNALAAPSEVKLSSQLGRKKVVRAGVPMSFDHTLTRAVRTQWRYRNAMRTTTTYGLVDYSRIWITRVCIKLETKCESTARPCVKPSVNNLTDVSISAWTIKNRKFFTEC